MVQYNFKTWFSFWLKLSAVEQVTFENRLYWQEVSNDIGKLTLSTSSNPRPAQLGLHACLILGLTRLSSAAPNLLTALIFETPTITGSVPRKG